MKKVLIITYYWPPSGGGGVQRWLKFAKYLPEYGWQPIIVAPDNAEYPTLDTSLLNDINPNLELIKVPIWEPYHLFKLLTGKKKNSKVNSGILKDKSKQSSVEKLSIWIRGNLLIPDPRKFWVKPTSKKLTKYLDSNPVDAIITTGPPHSVHLTGLKLKKKTGIKWIADFRDPWSEIDYLEEFHLSKRAMRKQIKLEHTVLTTADNIITVSENWAKDLKRLGAKNVEVITNGFDEEDFKNFDYNVKPDNFTLLYSGFIHSYRNPKYLWDKLEELCQTNEDFASRFRLKFCGTIDQLVIDYFNSLPLLSKRFDYVGYISHHQLLKEYEKATALLLIQNNSKNALGHIPGKLFEYLASRKPIIAISNQKSDVSNIIKECNAGLIIDNEKIDEVINSICNTPKIHHSNIQNYSRNSLTKNLIEVLSRNKN